MKHVCWRNPGCVYRASVHKRPWPIRPPAEISKPKIPSAPPVRNENPEPILLVLSLVRHVFNSFARGRNTQIDCKPVAHESRRVYDRWDSPGSRPVLNVRNDPWRSPNIPMDRVRTYPFRAVTTCRDLIRRGANNGRLWEKRQCPCRRWLGKTGRHKTSPYATAVI